MKIRIPSIRVRLPRVPALPTFDLAWRLGLGVKIPRHLHILRHRRGALLATVAVVALTLGVGGLYAIRGIETAPTWPDPAVYHGDVAQAAGRDQVQVGKAFPSHERTQTLQLNIPGVRCETIRFEDVSVGKATGLTHAIVVTADATKYLELEELTIDGLIATSLDIYDSQIYEMVITASTADGASVSPTLSGTPLAITVGSVRGALGVGVVKDSTFDRIIIDAGATDATCQKLEFVNVKAFGAGVYLSNLKVNRFTLTNSVIGSGNGINTADVTVGASVLVGSSPIITDFSDDVPVSVK